MGRQQARHSIQGRNFINAGIDETTARKFTGHQTRSMFDRYNIRSLEDIKRATEKMEESRNKVREAHKIMHLPG